MFIMITLIIAEKAYIYLCMLNDDITGTPLYFVVHVQNVYAVNNLADIWY